MPHVIILHDKGLPAFKIPALEKRREYFICIPRNKLKGYLKNLIFHFRVKIKSFEP